MHTKIRHADHTVKTGLISFCEGTRFTQSKYASSINLCKEHNHPIMKHALYPRMHGFIATMSALRHTKRVRAVCDMTCICPWKQVHAGTKFLADNFDLAKEGHKLYIHDDRYDTNKLSESEGQSKWLEEIWIKKGERLEMLRDKLVCREGREEQAVM
jgi:hypothetical protein